MKYSGSYEKAKELRLAGKSYAEIRAILNVPKSTQSNWFRDLKLSPAAQSILETKRREGFKRFAAWNQERTARIIHENESIRREQEAVIGHLSERELMLIGAALYWGEGYKNFKKGDFPILSFANSDPQMIVCFMKFLLEFLKISVEKIKSEVMLYPGIYPEVAIGYWQNLTKIPRENFCYYIALSRASQGRRPKNLLPYGTLQLRVNRRQEFFKIRGLIDGIISAAQ